MNIDKFSNSATTSKTEVISKYFSKEDDRDDSLLEFQEKKKNVAGPKTIKPKTKKKQTKQSKAQRDIRNLLNPKRNELIKYSKDFDHLCKQSGIDVDPEQLQLAVVLSKSLQDSENVTPKLGDESKPLSSQERTLKIRKTLQEYGFKVPQNVIVKKGGRKLKKNYKLLLLSNTEKEQIISDRYSQVLLNSCKTIHHTLHNISNDTLYYKATNISYEDLKNDDLLVLEPLEKPSNDLNLLRSWVEIPGRPASPVFEGPYISFKDIQCSQDQLDILLSGSIKRSHEIIQRKLIDNAEVSYSHINEDFIHQINNPDMKIDKINSKCDTQMSNTVKTLLSPELERSKSPDMFDDEVSSIMDEETEKPIDNKYKTIISHDTMDLTECVNISNNTNIKLPVLNATRKKSNDFMEITDCVVQTNQQNLHFEEIDLTQEPNDNNDSISFKHCIKENSPDSNLICVIDETNEDLNESDKNETIIEGAKINCTVNNNIVVEDSVLENYNESNHINNNSNDLVNILDSSDDELPDIKISGKNMSLDDNIIINEDCKKADKSNFDLEDNHDPVFDLTSEEQKPSCSYKTVENSNNYNNYYRNNVNSSNNETGLYKEKLDLILSPENDLNQPSCSYIAKIDNNSNSSHSSSRTIILNNILDVENTDDDVYHTKCSNLNSIENKNDVKKLEIMNRKSSDDHEIENYDDHIIFSQSSNSIFSDNDIEEQSQDMALNNDENSGLEVINNVNNEESDEDTEPYDNVDLTLSSNSSVNENTQSMSNNYVSNLPSCSGSFVNLGKINDKSVDYDEMFDDVVENFSNVSKSSTKSENHNKPNISISNEQKASTSSYQSVSIEISDKGVNDSTNAVIQENFDFGGISVLDNFVGDEKSNRDSLPSVNVKQTENDTQQSSPLHSNEHFDRMKTPDNEYIVKVDQVTPKPDYEAMSTPEMHRELDKYGVKPFKRKRAIKLLTYIYDQTHPFVESCIEETLSPSKKLKTSHPLQEISKSPEKLPQNDVLMIEKENTCIYVQTNDRPIIKDIECSPEDWVFQKREKAKIHSCRVPLHIAFHNYVSCRRLLREAILCYEPINIDIVHKDLVASGYKYNPKDLLKFMDKKCITVKTADNNARNKR
ncbi:structure-specific endonuclease subunit SLX4 [Colias croceus]|uniref:structure-specific endonuclease subunit SLX4 n=1 Tax=Colias crocea TaxID=72248 RepID=UPI001E27F172|nr:structure-specific endonuclease subunit SLX4 [Colias croceus]